MGVDTKWLAKHLEEQEERVSDDLVERLRTPVGFQDLPFIQEEAADRIEELEAKLAKALTALSDVQRFVEDLEPYADQGHTLVPALQKACDVYVELTGGKDE